MKTTKADYRKDKFYSKVTRAVHELLKLGDVITPLDVFVEMDKLAPKDVESWRTGRIPFIERVVHGNLSHCSRILDILQRHAADRGLKASWTDYRMWGKRNRKRRLRFTRHGHPHMERLWSTHYVRGSKRKSEAPADSAPPRTEATRPPRRRTPHEDGTDLWELSILDREADLDPIDLGDDEEIPF